MDTPIQQFGEDPFLLQHDNGDNDLTMVSPVWWWRTWLACTELWPQLHPQEMSQASSPNISDLIEALDVAEGKQNPAARFQNQKF